MCIYAPPKYSQDIKLKLQSSENTIKKKTKMASSILMCSIILDGHVPIWSWECTCIFQDIVAISQTQSLI